MTTRTIGALASTAVLAVGIGACGSSSKSSSSKSGSSSASTTPASTSGAGSGGILGAGSTFAAPVYQQWGTSSASGVTVNYQGVGSGTGISDFTAGTVDFGATDPPMKDTEVAAVKKGTPVHVPMFFGAITVSYNLPGVKSGLKLDGKTLADIFLGKVKTWNDAEIKKLNPGISLPSTAVAVIHRSDSSGTTAGFTGYLAAVDPAWASKVGTGKDVPWPTGTGAKGNPGVAAAVKQTPGGVGYVEQAFALQNNFTYASVKNSAGQFVTPTLASTTAAGKGIKVPSDLRFKVSNPKDPAAYPIVSQTFIVVYKDMCKAGVPGGQAAAKNVVKFLNYGLGAGQGILGQADYAALPADIAAKAKAAVAGLQCNGAPISG